MIDSKLFLQTSSLLHSYYTLLDFSNRMTLGLDGAMIAGEPPQCLSSKTAAAPRESALRQLVSQAKDERQTIAEQLNTQHAIPAYDSEALARINRANQALCVFEQQLIQWLAGHPVVHQRPWSASMRVKCTGFFARQLPVCVIQITQDQQLAYANLLPDFDQRRLNQLPGSAHAACQTFRFLYQYACLEPHEIAELHSIDVQFHDPEIAAFCFVSQQLPQQTWDNDRT